MVQVIWADPAEHDADANDEVNDAPSPGGAAAPLPYTTIVVKIHPTFHHRSDFMTVLWLPRGPVKLSLSVTRMSNS